MNIYLLNQDEKTGYDTYDSCIIIAENEEEAKAISIQKLGGYYNNTWPDDPNPIKVTFLGTSNLEKQLVCASFNAG